MMNKNLTKEQLIELDKLNVELSESAFNDDGSPTFTHEEHNDRLPMTDALKRSFDPVLPNLFLELKGQNYGVKKKRSFGCVRCSGSNSHPTKLFLEVLFSLDGESEFLENRNHSELLREIFIPNFNEHITNVVDRISYELFIACNSLDQMPTLADNLNGVAVREVFRVGNTKHLVFVIVACYVAKIPKESINLNWKNQQHQRIVFDIETAELEPISKQTKNRNA